MPRLTVILKHGFNNDRAVVKINGETALDRTGLTTKTTVDRATAFDRDVVGNKIRLDVEVPTRRLTKTIQLDISKQTSAVISIADGPRLQVDIVDGIVGDA